MQKCPDKNAKISFALKSVLKEEIKNIHNLTDLHNGMMPDVIKGAKVQQPVSIQSNQPTTDGFKKKVKIN